MDDVDDVAEESGDAAEEKDDEDEEEAELPEFSKMEQEDLDEEDAEVEVAEPFDGKSTDQPAASATKPFSGVRGADHSDTLLPAWSEISLHSRIKRALVELGFSKPTGIQERALPAGLSGRDVVGVAETVSFNLPPKNNTRL